MTLVMRCMDFHPILPIHKPLERKFNLQKCHFKPLLAVLSCSMRNTHNCYKWGRLTGVINNCNVCSNTIFIYICSSVLQEYHSLIMGAWLRCHKSHDRGIEIISRPTPVSLSQVLPLLMVLLLLVVLVLCIHSRIFSLLLSFMFLYSLLVLLMLVTWLRICKRPSLPYLIFVLCRCWRCGGWLVKNLSIRVFTILGSGSK